MMRITGLLLAAAVSTGCRPQEPDSAVSAMLELTKEGTIGIVPDSQLVINGLRLRMTPAAVQQVLGTPLTLALEFDSIQVDDTVRTLRYPSMSVVFIGQSAEYIRCSGEDCNAAGGVRVGDSLAAVEAVYGLGHPGLESTMTRRIYTHAAGLCGLTFEFEEGRVVLMHLWCDHS